MRTYSLSKREQQPGPHTQGCRRNLGRRSTALAGCGSTYWIVSKGMFALGVSESTPS